MYCRAGRSLRVSFLGLAFLLAIAVTPGLAHDFGGPGGPGGPPGGDGCPGCCGGGGGCGGCGGGGDPVNFWDGAERYYHTDFVLGGLFELSFARAYDSRSTLDTPLGYGWSHGFNHRLYRFPDGRVVIRKDCGARREFVFSGGAFVTPVGEQGELTENPDGTFDFIENTGFTLRFDVQGRLDRVLDARGGSLRLSYDPAGKKALMGTSPFSPTPGTVRVVSYDYQPTRIEEFDSVGTSTGRYYTLTYDGTSGRLTSVADHTARSWSFGHDLDGNLSDVTDPLTDVVTYGYTDPLDLHNMTTITGGEVDVTTAYDTEDRVLSQTYGDVEMYLTYTLPGVQTDVLTQTLEAAVVVASRNETWEFGPNGAVARHVDDAGNETVWTRNGSGQPTLWEYFENQGGTPTLVETVAYNYDTAGLLMDEVRTSLPGGTTVTTDLTYDNGRLASISEYNSTDPTEIYFRDWLYEHDGEGIPLNIVRYRRQKNPGAAVAEYDETILSYNADGQATTITYPSGETSNITFTGGYPTDVDGVLYGRDLRGNITSVTVDGTTTSYTHDALDRLSSVSVPGVGTTDYAYTGTRLTQVAHPTYTIDYSYDAVGRLEQVVQTVGATVTTLASVTYDKTLGTVTIVDADSVSRSWNWDPLRVWQKIENPETQSNRPSIFPTTAAKGATYRDPLTSLFVDILNQPGISLPINLTGER